MVRELWVDFNDLDRRGHTTTLSEFAEHGIQLTVGSQLVVGDDDGNLAEATVLGVGTNGSVALVVDLGTFAGCDTEMTACA